MRRIWLLIPLMTSILAGQELHLKTGTRAVGAGVASPVQSSVHHIIQFDHPPGAADLNALTNAGVRVIAIVPDNAVMAFGSYAAPAGVSELGALTVTEKLSPSL